MPTPSRYHHGNLRAALLAEARTLLEEAGPSALSLREIARRAGVAAPSVYHHFARLDALVLAVAEEGFAALAERLEASWGDGSGGLSPVGQAYVAFARAHPGLFRLMFGEGLGRTSGEGRALGRLRQRAYETIKGGLRERLPADEVEAGALFLWALTHGLAFLLIDGQIDLGTDPDAIVEMVLKRAGKGLPRANAMGGAA